MMSNVWSEAVVSDKHNYAVQSTVMNNDLKLKVFDFLSLSVNLPSDKECYFLKFDILG